MLKVMRENAKYFYVLFFIIILSFVFWGVGTMNNGRSGNIVAEVGNYKITLPEYQNTFENTENFYQKIYKNKFSDAMRKQLRQQVLDEMVVNRVLLIAARQNGITVSNEELNDAIRSNPSFQRDGQFDVNVYRNILRFRLQMSPEQFESSRRQELLAQKTRRLIELAASVPEEAMKQVSGDKKTVDALRKEMANQAKEQAVQAFVSAFQKKIKMKINRKLIS